MRTQGLYLQLIDSAIHLQRERFESVELRDKQRALGRIVQERLIAPLDQAQRKSGCEFILDPDPHGWRRVSGFDGDAPEYE